MEKTAPIGVLGVLLLRTYAYKHIFGASCSFTSFLPVCESTSTMTQSEPRAKQEAYGSQQSFTHAFQDTEQYGYLCGHRLV